MMMLRLRPRAWLGWGCAPDALRVQSADLSGMARIVAVGYGLVIPLFLILVGVFYSPVRFYAPSLFERGYALLYWGMFLLLCSYVVVMAMARRRLASRGEGQPPVTISGQCYEVVQGKSDIFARIGDSAETAQWYHLPLAWEAVVEPGASAYELAMNPATGFVERLRRLGDDPKELRQYSATEIAAGHVDTTYYLKDGEQDEDEVAGKATSEQRRELKRAFRSFGLSRGLGPDYFSSGGASMALLGLIPLGLTIWVAMLLSTNQWRTEPGSEGAGALIIGMTAFTFLFCAGYAIALLWIWRRIMASANEKPAQIEGVTVFWMP
jgi:hypothetical protein